VLTSPRLRRVLSSLAQSTVAVFAALTLGAVLIATAGTNPFDAYAALLDGAFGDLSALLRTLRTATPLIFSGLAVAACFRAGFFFLGQEGCVYVGGLSAVLAAVYLAPSLPGFLRVATPLLVGVAAGALWALIPALLRARLNVDEIVSSLMLNFIAILVVDFLVFEFFQDPMLGSNADRAVSAGVPPGTRLPFIAERAGLTWGFILALVAIVVAAVVFKRTIWGYESGITGLNRRFARSGGVKIAWIAISAIVVSGALAGLVGATETMGNFGRYIGGFSENYGFQGITIALMGRLNPLGIFAAALFFGGLRNGGASMEIATGLPRDLVVVVQGLILLLVTAQALLPLLVSVGSRRARRITVNG